MFLKRQTALIAVLVVSPGQLSAHISITMSSIHYRDMVAELDQCDHERSDKTFSLVYDECDLKRNTGGKRVELSKAKKCGLPFHCADHEMRGIIDEESGKKTAVHLRLIFQFNGKQVYW